MVEIQTRSTATSRPTPSTNDDTLRLIYTLKYVALLVLLPIILFAVALKHLLDYLFGLGVKEKDITGKVALITGGGTGLGREISFLLAKKGCKVAIVDAHSKDVYATADIIAKIPHAIAKPYKTDVSSPRELQLLAFKVAKDLGPIDILINNSAIMSIDTTSQLKSDEIEKIILVNLGSYIMTTKEFLPKMITRKSGHIVAVTASAGLMALPGAGIYSATQSGIIGFMDCLRAELKATDCDFVRVTTAHPYFVRPSDGLFDTYDDSGFLHRYPSMSTMYVAEKIVKGILKNERMIYVPRIFALTVWLLRLLPIKWQDYLLLQFYKFDSSKLDQIRWK